MIFIPFSISMARSCPFFLILAISLLKIVRFVEITLHILENRQSERNKKQKWKKLNDNKQRHAYPFYVSPKWSSVCSHSFPLLNAFQNAVNTLYFSLSWLIILFYCCFCLRFFLFGIRFVLKFIGGSNGVHSVLCWSWGCCCIHSSALAIKKLCHTN